MNVAVKYIIKSFRYTFHEFCFPPYKALVLIDTLRPIDECSRSNVYDDDDDVFSEDHIPMELNRKNMH